MRAKNNSKNKSWLGKWIEVIEDLEKISMLRQVRIK